MTHRIFPGIALAAVLLIAGCSGSDTATEEAPAVVRVSRVETMIVEPTTFEDAIEVTGTVEATDDAVLSAQAAGTITSLRALGTYVPAGGVVAQLDPSLAQAAVHQAEALVRQAEAQQALAEDNYRRQEGLYRDSIISATEFEGIRAQRATAQATVAQAEAGLAQAREQLRNTRIVAPFGGTVEKHLAERGEQAAPGTQVARLVSTDRVKVTAGVPERYAGDVRQGGVVDVQFSAYGGETRTGRITFIGSAVDPASRTFPVEIELANTDGRLKPAMVATVRVPRRRVEQALVVPHDALVRTGGDPSVYVVARKNSATVAERRAVETGFGSSGRVVVTAGLQPGDEVVVLGQTTLTDGDTLEVASTHSPAGEAVAGHESAARSN